ncbi:cell-cycle control medial ring component-domain-containing protein [Xylogone sp. PMI_703]|nr:cell-cycle control medial ring component-domain-containing protein [Xylogone sp. PMI_703]
MTEVSFAQSFLSALSSRPTKISSEHVEDPRTYPARSAYILPKMPKPLPKRQKLAPGQERSISVALKSLRNPPLDIHLSSQALSTSVLALKEEVSSQASIPVDKIRILYKKKPVTDSKVLKDLVGEDEQAVEFSVMVIGGAAAVVVKDEAPTAQGSSGASELATDEFWGDLKGYLVQRLRDEKEGERVFGVFKTAWDSQGR